MSMTAPSIAAARDPRPLPDAEDERVTAVGPDEVERFKRRVGVDFCGERSVTVAVPK
jgi:hypothetical protein